MGKRRDRLYPGFKIHLKLMRKAVILLNSSLFLIGFFLLILNLIGILIPLSSPNLGCKNTIKGKPLISEKDFYTMIKRNSQSDKEYILTVNNAVNLRVAHCWNNINVDDYRLRVPVYENYLLWMASFINPEKYLRYEFCDYSRQ